MNSRPAILKRGTERFSLVDLEQAEPHLKNDLQSLGIPFADLPRFIRLLANSPPALKAFVFWEKALDEGELPPALREKIALAVAEINGLASGIPATSPLLFHAGLGQAEAAPVRQPSEPDP